MQQVFSLTEICLFSLRDKPFLLSLNNPGLIFNKARLLINKARLLQSRVLSFFANIFVCIITFSYICKQNGINVKSSAAKSDVLASFAPASGGS
jgi:hypothetical protein